jgi:DNA-binding transcriptional LysR family regulator
MELRHLLKEATAILEHVKLAALRCQLSAQAMMGRVSVGLTESAWFRSEVTNALHQFRSLYPQVDMTLEESRTGPLIDALRQGRIDIAFVRLPVGADISSIWSCRMERIRAHPAGYPDFDAAPRRYQKSFDFTFQKTSTMPRNMASLLAFTARDLSSANTST